MNYLFFDIECANCDRGNGKICSFGYVLTDEAFNVRERRDLIMNPKAKFKLKGYGDKYYIQLAYPESVFLSSPDFTHYYDKIKTLLSTKETLVFGFAPENDARFLCSEFRRYGLESVDFVFYDIQRLFRSCITGKGSQLSSLSSACEALCIDTALITHKSCDDAYASMLILKELSKMAKKSPEILVYENSDICGELKDGVVSARYIRPKNVLKPNEKNMLKLENIENFRFLLSNLPYGLRGCKRKICFSWPYEFYHYREMVVLVLYLAKLGIKYTPRLSGADIFVKKPTFVKMECKREKAVTMSQNIDNNDEFSNIKPNIEIMEFDELLTLIGISAEKLQEEAMKADEYIERLKNGTEYK